MAQIEPILAVVGGDDDRWGDKSNIAFGVIRDQGNDHDLRLLSLEAVGTTTATRITSLESLVRTLQAQVTALANGGTPGASIGIDVDGTPYVIPPTGSIFLSEQGDRMQTEGSDNLVVENASA